MLGRQLNYRHSSIHYYQFGNGNQPVICFHGYGEEAASWLVLQQQGDASCTFFAVDLPFHGKTNWQDGLDFSHVDLLKIIQMILPARLINQKPIIMGFSLGGRVALSLYQADPASIQKLVLLAPDGLVLNPWYWLATQTVLGNRLFRFTMRHPKWFFALLKGLNRLKLVNTSIYKFVSHYIGDAEARQLLYTRWTCLRKLKPNLARIKTFIKSNHTSVRLIYGKHDRIILPVRGELFRKGIEPWCEITVLNTGHQVLQSKYVSDIIKALQTEPDQH